jgi:hypothetical protein
VVGERLSVGTRAKGTVTGGDMLAGIVVSSS